MVIIFAIIINQIKKNLIFKSKAECIYKIPGKVVSFNKFYFKTNLAFDLRFELMAYDNFAEFNCIWE